MRDALAENKRIALLALRCAWRSERKLNAILRQLNIMHEENTMEAKDMDAAVAALQEEVTQTVTLEESAIKLITSIPDLMNEAVGNGPDAVKALAATLAAKGAELAAALVANTPGAPPGPVVAPTPPPAPPAEPETTPDPAAAAPVDAAVSASSTATPSVSTEPSAGTTDPAAS